MLGTKPPSAMTEAPMTHATPAFQIESSLRWVSSMFATLRAGRRRVIGVSAGPGRAPALISAQWQRCWLRERALRQSGDEGLAAQAAAGHDVRAHARRRA